MPVATFSGVTRAHILQAIDECDRRGHDDFLGVYGYAPAAGGTLRYEGRAYDPAAVLGVAHRYATGRVAVPDEVRADLGTVVALLRRRGFEVGAPAGASAPSRSAGSTTTRRASGSSSRASGGSSSSRPAAARRRPSDDDRPVAICPTCAMALPATGVCDTCG